MLHRKIAYIDLTRGTISQEEVPAEWRRNYLGGRGINMLLLYSMIDRSTDPLGPENPLIFGVGLLTGSLGFGTGRFNISAASPTCGNIGDSNCGGHFGPQLKYAGFDHLVITGKSSSPVYLLVTNDRIEIRDARHLWGKDTWETQLALKAENQDERIQVATIGPAGENLVRLACVMTGPKDAAGRTGMGAVMGSKNLKAVAVRGSKDLEVVHPRELLSYFKEQTDLLMTRKWIKALGRLGTPLLFAVAQQGGWIANRPEQERGKVENLYADNLLPYSVGMAACGGCAVHCRHRHRITQGRFAGTWGEGPEYGAIGGVGLEVGNMDLEGVICASNLCNRLGLDVTLGGRMIEFALEICQAGVIDPDHLGRTLEGGNLDGLFGMLEDMAYRREFGDILADGPYALRRLPPEAAHYMCRIKNMPAGPPGWGVVRSFSQAMAVSSLPAHAHRNRPGIDVLKLPAEVLEKLYGGPVSPDFREYEGKSRMVWWHELLYVLCDALGCCRFQTAFNSPNSPKHEEYRELIRLSLGLDLSLDDLREIGERTYTIERLLLRAFGVGSRKDDALPERWTSEPGPGQLDLEKHEQFLDEYYQLHGWDRDGAPPQALLEKLGIQKVQRQTA